MLGQSKIALIIAKFNHRRLVEHGKGRRRREEGGEEEEGGKDEQGKITFGKPSTSARQHTAAARVTRRVM